MHEEMLNSLAVSCPYCGTEFDLLIDTSQESHITWEDCPRCCAPIQISVAVSPHTGELEQVTLGRDDDVV
ncbi:Cysteine-rich CPXCG [Modicisalibacter muralis]|uniref:Cysteine-rich CPXCG n=1 Tax=Modicisalibacter muralis TaxID=119000 RepID=A0A1G9R4X8_9GAMM|nr:CPXCG motif-containing cysteine-rich protein [Halomonas muralis]SDM18356.1 Cysteine-rich CPXCG [Halomonas muralis]